MRRAAIILATILFTGILPFSSLSLATSDEEIDHAADEMRAAFRCSKYAGMFNDLNEAHRLFQIGLKAGRDYVEGLKSRDDPTSEMLTFLRGVSTDFVVGQLYESESTDVYDEIAKLDASEAKIQAERSYREGNCSLIN